jgi:hypothetical protein
LAKSGRKEAEKDFHKYLDNKPFNLYFLDIFIGMSEIFHFLSLPLSIGTFCTEAGILVENFHRRVQALKSTLNFLGKSPCISLGFSERDRSLKQVRTLGTLKFWPQKILGSFSILEN